MEKNVPDMHCPTLLMIHQLILNQLKTYNKRKTKIESNLQRIGASLGKKIMMRVANVHSSKTRDIPQILRLFANEFWEFVFGKKGAEVVSMNTNSINFKDKDFELVTRVSGEDSNEADIFVSLIETFCIAIFEAALEFLNVSADVRMQKMDKYLLVEVECTGA